MKIVIAFIFILGVASAIEYNATISKQFHKYCLVTHCSKEQLINWSCPLCKEADRLVDLKYIENKATWIMAMGGYSQRFDKLFYVFRGTENLQNWVQDFSYKQLQYKKCSNCKIHEGFYLSYLSIANQVYSTLSELKNKYSDKELIILGSSLGGALATVAAIQIHTQHGRVSQLHTYGSPRVGNGDFSMYIKTRIPKSLRVVHNKDIVPHVPLQSQNYHHIPFQVWFNQEMNSYKICADSGEDTSCSNSNYPNFSIKDHTSYWGTQSMLEICGK